MVMFIMIVNIIIFKYYVAIGDCRQGWSGEIK